MNSENYENLISLRTGDVKMSRLTDLKKIKFFELCNFLWFLDDIKLKKEPWMGRCWC